MMKMRSYGQLSHSPVARGLTTIIEHSDENIAAQSNVQLDSEKSKTSQPKKIMPKRSMSCCEFTKPDYPPLLRRSQSETITLGRYTAQTYTDFLQTVGAEDESENTATEDAFKQGKETLDRWMKFFVEEEHVWNFVQSRCNCQRLICASFQKGHVCADDEL
ncbi:hypothetical protein AC249_AIPGENE1576 [Exaiptasia diaphana]|nr:hypothetical protein AC249_AIPGENE1576 [Exaiptasia diaphana]